MNVYTKSIILTIFALLPFRCYSQVPSQPPKIDAKVLQVLESGHPEFGAYYQKLEVVLKDGKKVTAENNPQTSVVGRTFSAGDRVIVQAFVIGESTSPQYIITDYRRTDFLVFLFILFAILSILIGKKYGVYSLIGMGFSFLVIFKFILPQTIAGSNPIFITVVASLFIIPITFYLSHGFNKKTHTAIASTIITLVITSIFTGIAVSLAHLSGFSSEEAMFLQVGGQQFNMKGILLAGIIIGFLGVLDDVTVSQASIVTQLRKAKRNYPIVDLYRDAMEVGRDHITSMINTLVLVYTGASLPLLLLFMNNPQPFWDVLNMEIIADEIIRTLVGSIGLILSVPLSTFIASIVVESTGEE